MSRYFKILAVFGFVLLYALPAQGNPTLEKAIKHFKDFEIKQGLKLLKQLESDSSLPSSQKAKVSLYMAMSYAYLRNKPKANEYFKKAVQQNPSIVLPKGTPKRLRKLFINAKSSAGGTPSTPALQPAPRRTAPPAVVPPPAAPRRTAPPPRRRFRFGSFRIKRKAPQPRPQPRREADPLFPPARRATKPVVTAPPPQRRRRVAQADPTLGDPDTSLVQKKSAPPRMTGGLWMGAWITMGLAVALVGVGAGLGAMASSQAGLASSPQTFQVDVPNIQTDAQRSALLANIMFAAAGASAATAIVLFVVAPKGKPARKKSVDALSQRPLSTVQATLSALPTPARTVPFSLLP